MKRIHFKYAKAGLPGNSFFYLQSLLNTLLLKYNLLTSLIPPCVLKISLIANPTMTKIGDSAISIAIARAGSSYT